MLLTAIGSGSVSADESVPPPTTTTVLEQFDEESGIDWSPIDEQTIEGSLPNLFLEFRLQQFLHCPNETDCITYK